jgi:hypothetical protein
VRYPILPKITRAGSRQARRESCTSAIIARHAARFRHLAYFEIVKPTIVQGFDYTALHWATNKAAPGSGRIRRVSTSDQSPPLVLRD